MDTCCSAQSTVSTESQPRYRLAHKSSFWARSASERSRSCRVLPHQTRKPSERLWESLTSLMRTLHCQLCAEETFPFLKVKRPLVDRMPMFPTLQCTGKDDFRHQFQTILASNLLCKERSWFLRYHINERFESFSKFTPRNDGFVIFRDVSFDDAFVLFYFFSFMLKQMVSFSLL